MIGASDPVAELRGRSRAIDTLRTRIRRIAPTIETVLITGESGTGKDLIARTLHLASGRPEARLVPLNCALLAAQPFESELFGHERGAFPGADELSIGRFEAADGGTLLLDHVTELAPSIQAALLRVLEEKCFERLGSITTIQADVRVLATSSRQLDEEMISGRFRADLYYRLAVVPLHIPPLRDRSEDIPDLVEFFLQRVAQRLQREPHQVDTEALELLQEYHWPGNVRELENIIIRASVLGDRGRLSADRLRPWLNGTPLESTTALPTTPLAGFKLHEFERLLIESTLAHYAGHRAKTAEALGIGVRTLSGKLKQYGHAPRTSSVPKAHVPF